jgi:transposase
VRRRAEFYYQQLDALRVLRQEVRRDLLVESKNRRPGKRLCQIPSIGPIRAAVLLGILQTPHRFRSKRPLWNYGGLGIEMHSSADHRSVDGQLQRSRKNVLVRGLNRNCNHDLKNLFKGAAAVASSKPGPFREFYTALVAKGMRPEMARLTLARKIATIVLSKLRRPISETTNSLSVSDRVRSIPGIFSGGGLWVLETPRFESESQLGS